MCAHAFAVAKWKAKTLPDVVLKILKKKNSILFDNGMYHYSLLIGPVPLIGENLHPPGGYAHGHIGKYLSIERSV